MSTKEETKSIEVAVEVAKIEEKAALVSVPSYIQKGTGKEMKAHSRPAPRKSDVTNWQINQAHILKRLEDHKFIPHDDLAIIIDDNSADFQEAAAGYYNDNGMRASHQDERLSLALEMLKWQSQSIADMPAGFKCKSLRKNADELAHWAELIEDDVQYVQIPTGEKKGKKVIMEHIRLKSFGNDIRICSSYNYQATCKRYAVGKEGDGITSFVCDGCQARLDKKAAPKKKMSKKVFNAMEEKNSALTLERQLMMTEMAEMKAEMAKMKEAAKAPVKIRSYKNKDKVKGAKKGGVE
jgi:hypothetical protein